MGARPLSPRLNADPSLDLIKPNDALPSHTYQLTMRFVPSPTPKFSPPKQRLTNAFRYCHP